MEDNQQSLHCIEITDLSDVFIEISDSDAESISGGWGWPNWASVAVGVAVGVVAVLTGGSATGYHNADGDISDDFSGAGGEWNF